MPGKANKISKKKIKRKPYKHASHRYITQGHKVFHPPCEKSQFLLEHAPTAPYLWRAQLCRPQAASPRCPGTRQRRGPRRGLRRTAWPAPHQHPARPRTAAPARRAGGSTPASSLAPTGSTWPSGAQPPQTARWHPHRATQGGCQQEHPSPGAKSRHTHPTRGRVKSGVANCSMCYIGAGGGAEKGDSL